MHELWPLREFLPAGRHSKQLSQFLVNPVRFYSNRIFFAFRCSDTRFADPMLIKPLILFNYFTNLTNRFEFDD
jgi:hypothetical protein